MSRSFVKRFLCWLLFHDLIVDHWCSPEAAKLECRRCGRFFGIHHGVRCFLEWTPELELCEERQGRR